VAGSLLRALHEQEGRLATLGGLELGGPLLTLLGGAHLEQAALTAWAERVEKGTAQMRAVAAKILRHWQADPDFTGVRGPAALAQLPEAERATWQRLWAEVQALRDKAGGKGTDAK
jgi:hypothetical protein